jgi:hypothetical protein
MPATLASELEEVTEMPPGEPNEPQHALRVAIVYQDVLTREWATELWDRVEQLTDRRKIQCKSWNISELAHDGEFPLAVNAAAEADVLVISVRDTGELPLFLHVWIDAWIPRRRGREGALVAILGVPAQPDAQCGYTRDYLEAVAHRVGLDYLPRERTLPNVARTAAVAVSSSSSTRPRRRVRRRQLCR